MIITPNSSVGINTSGFPNQKLTYSEKIELYGSIEEWANYVMRAIVNINGFNTQYSERNYANIVQNSNLFNGIFVDSEYASLQAVYGDKDYNFPTKLTHYDQITGKVQVLLGEETKRGFHYNVSCTNEDAVSEYENANLEMIYQALSSQLQSFLEEQGHLQAPDQQQGGTPQEQQEAQQPKMSLQNVEKYMKYNYKGLAEQTANKALKYIIKYCYCKDKFSDGFKDFLVTGHEIYKVYSNSQEPMLRRIDPLLFEYDKTNETEYIDDAMWAKEWRFISASQVMDEFYDDLSKEEVDLIQDYMRNPFALAGRMGDSRGIGAGNSIVSNTAGDYSKSDSLETSYSSNTPFFAIDSTTMIRVEEFEWKSLRNIGFLTRISETGEAIVEVVDENYKKQKGEKVEWKWINEVWEATRIGVDIIIKVRPKEQQFRSLNNLSKCRLSYTGLSMLYPLVERMKPLQALYNIMTYKLKMTVVRAKGLGFIMDLAQIPLSKDMDIQKFLYYLETTGLAFINSLEEGKDDQRGKYPQFNQFQQLNLSIGQDIVQYINILAKIENDLGNISGVTRQREGQMSNSETLGGIERSITQSSHITERYFMLHDRTRLRVLTNLLEQTKVCWKTGKKLMYIMDDLSRVYMELGEGNKYLNSDFDLFVTNNPKDQETLDFIRKQLAPQALQSGTLTTKDLIALMLTESLAEAKLIMDEAQESANKMREQQQQSEQQHAQQMQQMQEKAAQVKFEQDSQLKQMQFESQDTMNQRDNDTKLQIAQLQTQTQLTTTQIAAENTDAPQGVDDTFIKQQQLEIEKEYLRLDKTIAQHDMAVDDKKLEQANIKIEQDNMKFAQDSIKLSQGAEKLEIDRKKANKPTTSK